MWKGRPDTEPEIRADHLPCFRGFSFRFSPPCTFNMSWGSSVARVRSSPRREDGIVRVATDGEEPAAHSRESDRVSQAEGDV